MLIVVVLSYSWLFIFFISFYTASVTKEIHKSNKYLQQLQWLINEKNLKLKVRYWLIKSQLWFDNNVFSCSSHTNVLQARLNWLDFRF
jgi:hypothetical protein